MGGLLIRGTHQEQLEAVIRALDLGINYFDTAPAYGDGRSESNLGRVLAELRPQVIVATKVHLRGSGLKDVKGAVQRSLEASLNRLGRHSVDVLQLHTQVSMERGRAGLRDTVDLKAIFRKDGVVDAFEAMRS
ncbi:1-deoxyxylulose-5-phosphate synthase YajO [subsurface metagenome]